MEDLFGLIMVIVAIAASIAKKKKKAGQGKNTGKIVLESLEETLGEAIKGEKPKPAPVVPAAPAPVEPAPAKAPAAPAPLERLAEAGSLGEVSQEGIDPCHEEQFDDMDNALVQAPAQEEAPGLALDWSGESMVKAFIMQEVLNRPGQRRRSLS